MYVWAEKVESWLDATDDCPYCGARLKIEYEADGNEAPDELTCPVCGEVMSLLTEWEPSFGLFKRWKD